MSSISQVLCQVVLKLAVAFDAARRDEIRADDLAALDDAPARGLQGGIDVLGSGLDFVHSCLPIELFGIIE